jgi:hypothetical protein
LDLIHESGNWNGSAPVARSNAPVKLVNGVTAWSPSIQPLTVPYDRRSVNVASGSSQAWSGVNP